MTLGSIAQANRVRGVMGYAFGEKTATMTVG